MNDSLIEEWLREGAEHNGTQNLIEVMRLVNGQRAKMERTRTFVDQGGLIVNYTPTPPLYFS